MEWKNKGIKTDGKQFNNLQFVDDVALFSDDLETLQIMETEFEKTSREVGSK